MQVKELIKELQGLPQDKKVNIYITKIWGEDSSKEIYHDDISHIIEQEDTVEIYFNKLED